MSCITWGLIRGTKTKGETSRDTKTKEETPRDIKLKRKSLIIQFSTNHLTSIFIAGPSSGIKKN